MLYPRPSTGSHPYHHHHRRIRSQKRTRPASRSVEHLHVTGWSARSITKGDRRFRKLEMETTLVRMWILNIASQWHQQHVPSYAHNYPYTTPLSFFLAVSYVHSYRKRKNVPYKSLQYNYVSNEARYTSLTLIVFQITLSITNML